MGSTDREGGIGEWLWNRQPAVSDYKKTKQHAWGAEDHGHGSEEEKSSRDSVEGDWQDLVIDKI